MKMNRETQMNFLLLQNLWLYVYFDPFGFMVNWCGFFWFQAKWDLKILVKILEKTPAKRDYFGEEEIIWRKKCIPVITDEAFGRQWLLLPAITCWDMWDASLAETTSGRQLNNLRIREVDKLIVGLDHGFSGWISPQSGS